MASHSIAKILGIGPKTRGILEGQGIQTVGDLAKTDSGKVSNINNLNTFISRSKTYIAERQEKVEKKGEKITEVLINGTNTIQKTESVLEEEDFQEEIKTLTEHHSWWEHKILIPKKNSKGELDLIQAVIYELSIEACERIAFICCWMQEEEEDEEEITMTFSPQLIRYFNTNLPELTLSINPEEWKSFKNRYTIKNVLWETNMMNDI